MTPEQNLQDLATFIMYVRREYNTEASPVILWGSGYGATTATWALKKFPHLVHAAWASSGIFEMEVDTVGE